MKSTRYVHKSIKQKQCRVCCWSGELVLHSTHTSPLPTSPPPRPKQRWIANGGNWLLDQPLVQPPTTTTRIPTEFLFARRPFCQHPTIPVYWPRDHVSSNARGMVVLENLNYSKKGFYYVKKILLVLLSHTKSDFCVLKIIFVTQNKPNSVNK